MVFPLGGGEEVILAIEKVVECLKRYFTEVRLVNLGTRGLNVRGVVARGRLQQLRMLGGFLRFCLYLLEEEFRFICCLRVSFSDDCEEDVAQEHDAEV